MVECANGFPPYSLIFEVDPSISNMELGMQMPFWSAFRKKRAIRGYMRKLPSLLAKNFGASQSYTAEQVRRTIVRSGLNTDYTCYALAIFSDRAAFDRFHTTTGENCDYDIMRSEISQIHFDGAADFTLADVLAEFSEPSSDTDVTHEMAGGDSHSGHGHY